MVKGNSLTRKEIITQGGWNFRKEDKLMEWVNRIIISAHEFLTSCPMVKTKTITSFDVGSMLIEEILKLFIQGGAKVGL